MTPLRPTDITGAIFGPALDGQSKPACRMWRPDNDAPRGAQGMAAVVILPGGSYTHHADHEGEAVALRLVRCGLVAFLLEYALGPVPLCPHVLEQPGQVLAYVRAHAGQLGVDAARIGLLGFSAGGHLAALSTCTSQSVGELGRLPCAIGLIYAVVSFRHDAHARSTAAWLGPAQTDEARRQASVEEHVATGFPRTFVVAAADDDKVSPSHALRLTQACLAQSVSVELHLLAQGGHGFGLGAPPMWDWCTRFVLWFLAEP